jgi:ubiquinone biosynthesis monooxygenase Coq6
MCVQGSSVVTDPFADIGAWQQVEQERTNPIEEMQVWDGISDSRIEFNATGASASPLEMARLTENVNLQRGLLRQIDKSAPAGTLTLLDKIKVLSITSDAEPGSQSSSGWPLLHLSTSQTIRARLLVGADGPSSPVRAFSKIESYGWPYNARAIVATLEHGKALSPFGTPRNHTTAYQRFLPTGPIAFLPLASTRASMVWSTTPELAQALLDAGEGVLSLMINAAFRLPDVSIRFLHRYILEKWGASSVKKDYVGREEIEREIRWREQSHGISLESPLTSFRLENEEEGIPAAEVGRYPPLVHSIQSQSAASFPLRMSHADMYVGKRTALVGDAAHTVHPLAGQGLNLGIADAEALARTIGCATLLGADIGSDMALEGYPRDRYLANHGMLSGVDKLAKLYGTRMGPVVWLRSVGIEVVNEWTGVKEAFMSVAGAGDKPTERRSDGSPKATQLPKIDAAAAIEGIGGIVDSARTALSVALGNSRR